MIAAVSLAGWRLGMFVAFPDLGSVELTLAAVLCGYGAIGFVAAFLGRFETARHIANGVPIWGLGCTGLGMLLAVAALHSLTPTALAGVFRDLAFAISPNIVGVGLMAWLREIIWWCGGAET